MAKIRINGDTSGYIEISAPAVAGSTSITLPATTGGNFLVTDSSGNLNVDSGTLYVDATNNRVGIGTSSPGHPLHVIGTSLITGDAYFGASRASQTGFVQHVNIEGTDVSLQLYQTTTGSSWELGNDNTGLFRILNGGTNRLVIDTSGRVGIGTSGPSNRLHIQDTSGNSQLRLTGTGGYAELYSDGNFYIQPNGSTKMVVQSGGNVGIGTTSPTSTLHANSNDNSNTFIASGATGKLRVFGHSSSFGGPWLAALNSAESAYLPLSLTGSEVVFAPAGTERARIDSSGRLLVGTSSSANDNIAGTGYVNLVQIVGGATGAGLAVRNTADVSRINIVRSANLATDTEIGNLSFGAEATSVERARIGCFTETTGGSGGRGGSLRLYTSADSSPTPSERMRIKNDGRIVAGDGFSTSYGQVLTAVKVGDTGKYFGIGDQGNGCNALSRDPGTTNFIHIQFNNGNGLVGTITSSGSSTAYNTSSDYRLKENIVLLTGATDRLKQIPVHRFNFIADPDKTVDGFIAHEAQAVVPECVTGEKDAVDEDGNPIYQGIDQSKLVPLLTAALQEAIGEIEALKARVAALESG